MPSDENEVLDSGRTAGDAMGPRTHNDQIESAPAASRLDKLGLLPASGIPEYIGPKRRSSSRSRSRRRTRQLLTVLLTVAVLAVVAVLVYSLV